MPEIRSLYSRSGFRPVLKCESPTLTEQHHRESCDVNYIIDVFQRTGKLEPGNRCFYEDVSDRPDNLLDCMETVQRANALFASIPSRIRSRFDNDPVKLLDWLHDPANRKEAGELGLLSKLPDHNIAPEDLQGAQSAHDPNLILNVPTDTNGKK